MPTTFTLIDLAGSIALLLLGTQMVQSGMQRAFGTGLQPFLSGSRDRGHAFVAGMGVTAVLQSGTATGSMTASLAATGRVDLVLALAVMLGANVGATLIVQMLSFDVAAVSPALILVGVLMFRRTSNTRAHDLGRAFIGLGLMLLALHELLDLMTDYEDAPSLRMLLGAASTVPLVDVLLAASLSWAADSNVAVVLLVASLCAKNVVPPDTAFALVLGANLGTAIKPVLDWTVPDDPASRRLPVGNLLILVTGVTLVLAALGPIGRFMVIIEPDNARVVADFHTLFNVVLAGLFLPLLTPYGTLLGQLMPAFIKVAEPSGSFHGDQADTPVQREAHDRPMRPALRLKADPGELLVEVRPRLRESEQVRTSVVHQRNDDVPDQADSNGRARLPQRDTVRHEADARQADARPELSIRDGDARGNRVIIRECGQRRLESTSDGGVLLQYEPARSIWLTLEDLRIVRQVEPAGGKTQPMLATYIHGTALLDDGYLCVIGEPWTRKRAVSVTFAARELNDGDHHGLRDWQDALGITFSDVPLGTARLGYNAPDHEMQAPGYWWASLNVPAGSMQGLVEGIDAARLTDVRLALTLKNLYSLTPEVADAQGNACVFLRPGGVDTTGLPEVATGYVTHMMFDLARISLGPPDGERSPDHDALPGRGGIQDTGAVRALDEKVGRLVILVKWLGALVAVLVLVFAFARH
ncbi:Na/Pi-cotransporter II-like protein [Paraburkholderia hospita]|uniref:Na/Pi-cotransporter II-like protein n=1 Tax=Paraburkholderia hospita TaxID=169430 RepID=A0ABP2P8C1_9BURK|nr:Na/Pi symporter [Paraburkholderia hospita]EIM93879.1 Na/Pi-cotransporter II-like protein [Paraburkholderia hospita]OUL80609.1 Na/Pi cotransporter [Paraburkholderia hospita]